MGNGGGGCGSASSKLRKVARRLILLPCALFSSSASSGPADSAAVTAAATPPASPSNVNSLMLLSNMANVSEITVEGESPSTIPSKNVCTICLEPLLSNGATSPGHAVFTAQCSHAFHLSCISSNIRHGSVTCPICRAHWTQLPRSLHPPSWLPRNPDDPILRILDHSITTFRVHRRSFLRSARYDDDDPVEPNQANSLSQPRISFSLTPLAVPQTQQCSNLCPCMHYSPLHITESLSPRPQCCYKSRRVASYLSIKVAPKQAIDLVLIASPNGSHLRLLKQCMAITVSSLRPIDRLAIVSYSSAAARIFPLRRMTTYGKRAALQVIDRLFYTGHADPIEGIKKGIKILKDRVHMNPHCTILHLSDNPARIRGPFHMEMLIPVHQFHVSAAGSILHEVEGFLDELIGGGIKETQLRIGDGEDAKIVRLGELRCDEERRILLDTGEDECCSHVCVSYSYVENGVGMDAGESISTGEVAVTAAGDGRQVHGHGHGHPVEANTEAVTGGRTSCVESWDYHDPYMARRWAKRLHGRQRF